MERTGAGEVCLFVPQRLDSAQCFAAVHSDASTKFAKTLFFKQTKSFKKWKKNLGHVLKHDIKRVVQKWVQKSHSPVQSSLLWHEKCQPMLFLMRLPALHAKDGKVGECASSSICINIEGRHSAR